MDGLQPYLIGLILLTLARRPSRAFSIVLLDQELHYELPYRYSREDFEFYLAFRKSLLHDRIGVIARHLRAMALLGLVRSIDAPEGNVDGPAATWGVVNHTVLNERFPEDKQSGLGSGDGRGGGDEGGGGGNSTGDGGTSGGGVREILGHPYLFALPRAEFASLVDGMFDGPGAP
ncbi:hypothetical protein H3H37_22300 [Duganella sp. LX20W]|uniref:Uncharacterized protein n=1 Tax=Rugamonas brunnea TaxID=2758569 RepID=A0A7W2EWA6_9BURK|nr:hypothetical protein [Rugamonas brunnea]MBA5639797.1 hypothetical protein [Rugamonas brunnea]